MHPISLSYIVATRNRLDFLKITLGRLLFNLQPDEEIVVIDGASTDGSKEYLQELYEQGEIHQYISEPDRNQAHAWNKAMLMARGTLIKKIIDDDVFCYNAIRKCKEYMLQNPQVDVVISNDLSSTVTDHKKINKTSRLSQFENWKQGLVPSFTFGDVHMLIRKSSLALIGFYNTSYVMMDWEYSLRISYLKANIAYYTGYNALSVGHPQSVSALRDVAFIDKQTKRAKTFYEYKGDKAEIKNWSKLKIFVGKTINYDKSRSDADTNNDENVQVELNVMYDHFYDYLSKLNDSGKFTFLSS
ncbi:MAG: glycosyltransferase [Bacteroidetes bacterium]|nr:glycosyltransferase [Bacteroidota bacterium]